MDALSPDDAQRVFDLLAVKGDEIAFRWLIAGCECRAQIMIEHIQTMGIVPGRAWAVAVGRSLAVVDPLPPHDLIEWHNHVAPAVRVAGAEQGACVIDPALSRSGPMALADWAGAMRAGAIEISTASLSQLEILNRQATRVLGGQRLDAILFLLDLGVPPIPELGGSGFRLSVDPPEGVSEFSRQIMRQNLALEKQPRPGQL